MSRRARPRSGACDAAGLWAGESSLPGKISTIVPAFVDTNILVYAEDRDAKDRHAIARDLVLDLWEARTGVVSVQVLQEFYVNVTRKLKKPLGAAKALEIVEQYLTWTVVENTGRLLVDAIAVQHKAQLSFWDAMVVQAAIEAGCEALYSEDLNAGQRFGSLVVVNPFR
jgi:predicted nucleic acid-binding protein